MKTKIDLGSDHVKWLFWQLDSALNDLKNASEQTDCPHHLRDFLQGRACELLPDVPLDGHFDVGYAVGFVNALRAVLDVDLDELIEMAEQADRPTLEERSNWLFRNDGTLAGSEAAIATSAGSESPR